MGRFKRGLIVVVRIITLGFAFRPDPNAPPDYTADKTKIDAALTGYLAALKKVRDDKKVIEGELTTLEATVKPSASGEKSNREALFDIKLKRKEVALLKAREGVLCGKVERAKILLGMIALYEDSRPMEVGEEVRKISERIQLRIDEINVGLDDAQQDAIGMEDAITVSDHDEELDRIEEEILERAKARDKPALSAEQAQAQAARAAAAREAVKRDDAGYEEVEDDGDDPPAAEPPTKQLESG